MKAVHDNLLPTESAYYRARFPDEWFWADVKTRLVANTATAVEKTHYLLAAQFWGEQVPEIFEWTEYGPIIDKPEHVDDVDQAAADIQKARDIATKMRGG